MSKIGTIEALEALYEHKHPSDAAMAKVSDRLTPNYRAWIMASRFCIVSTVGPEGVDGSPRGDDGPVVTELDEKTVAMPDWRGNNRLDTLRNIVRDDRIALMFMIPNEAGVIRLNGRAELRDDAELLDKFEFKGRRPRSVIVIHIDEIYTQCARAIMRSEIWSSDNTAQDLPSFGDILKEMTDGSFDGDTYDQEWPERAAKTMW